MKGSQKPKKTGKKPAQKSLKERRIGEARGGEDSRARSTSEPTAGSGQAARPARRRAGRRAARSRGRSTCRRRRSRAGSRPSSGRGRDRTGRRRSGTSPIRSYGAAGARIHSRQPVQDAGRLVEVEQRETDPVDAAADRLLDAVVDQEPAVLGLAAAAARCRSGSESHQAPSRGCSTCSGALQLTRSVGAREQDLAVRRRRTRSSGGGRGSTCRRSGAAAAPRSCPRAAG